MARADAELRELSGHVLWHVRQLCRLGRHTNSRRDRGERVALDPLDAAALEAFFIHGRALTEFVWRSRSDKPKPYKTDGLAEDYFDAGGWQPRFGKPAALNAMVNRVGSGLVHVSYRRLDPQEVWGWDVDYFAAAIYLGLIDFAMRVDPDRVAAGFGEAVRREFVDELRVDPLQAAIGAQSLGHSVGTPMLANWLPAASGEALLQFELDQIPKD
jgi:hypothetical protein